MLLNPKLLPHYTAISLNQYITDLPLPPPHTHTYPPTVAVMLLCLRSTQTETDPSESTRTVDTFTLLRTPDSVTPGKVTANIYAPILVQTNRSLMLYFFVRFLAQSFTNYTCSAYIYIKVTKLQRAK